MNDDQPKAQEKDGIVADLKARLAAAEKEITAWRASFPIMEVKPGALFASTKAEYELQDE